MTSDAELPRLLEDSCFISLLHTSSKGYDVHSGENMKLIKCDIGLTKKKKKSGMITERAHGINEGKIVCLSVTAHDWHFIANL